MRLIAIAPLVWLLGAAAVSAATGKGKPPADPNKPICKTLAPPIGSRIGERRVCKTKADWDQDSFNAKEVLERVQTHRGS
jgi:hypothetical protein